MTAGETHGGFAPLPLWRFAPGGAPASALRDCPAEVAVALNFNGTVQAVMMATPADLTDFAYGFALTEGLAAPADILEVTPVETALGMDLQITLKAEAGAQFLARRRAQMGPVGCGLCGIDSLAEALRPVPPVQSPLRLKAEEVGAALAALTAHQPLQDQTRAVHAAALWQPGAGLQLCREDVGRHNALDKLAGALVRGGEPPGALVMTSRLSLDLVQKAAMIGAPFLIGASAPTAAAVALAETAGITLIASARATGGFDLYTHPERIEGGVRDVA